jgi:BirA family biotin operon repressor/biotin-[acetyl-CoA-carboxylase] ligase
MSVILRPEETPGIASSPGLVPLWAGLAALGAIRECAGYEASLKWPNDIMAGERKLGGILLEARTRGRSMDHAVLGIGINVNSRENDFPSDLRDTATSLMMEAGRPQETEELIKSLTLLLAGGLARMGETGGPEAMLREYRASCSTLGRKVSASFEGGEVSGVAADIDETGRLLIRVDGELRPISSADVVHLR